MRLNQTPPKGAGRAQCVTKTERLIKYIVGLGHDKYGNSIAIRTKALAEATGTPANCIQGMLATAVKHGEIIICKVTPASGRAENEYRAGPGVPPPEFKPLNTQRNGIARGTATKPLHVTHQPPALSTPRTAEPATPVFLSSTTPQPAAGNTGSARSESTSTDERAVTSKPETPGLRPERRGIGPAPAKAPAGDVELLLSINQDGELQVGYGDDPARWVFEQRHVMALGDFLHTTQGLWRP